MKTDQASPAEREARYEPLDVPPLLPLWLAGILAAFVGGVLLYISIAFPLATHQQYRGPLKPLASAPRLQSAPMADLQRYQAAESQELAGSGRGVPIETAMRQTAKQGWGPPR